MGEQDPDGKDPNRGGAKLDFGKPKIRKGLLEQFPRACQAVALVTEFGANKYTWNGWETVPDAIERYGDAEIRHVCKSKTDGEYDLESHMLHVAHEAWNAMCVLELTLSKGKELRSQS